MVDGAGIEPALTANLAFEGISLVVLPFTLPVPVYIRQDKSNKVPALPLSYRSVNQISHAPPTHASS